MKKFTIGKLKKAKEGESLYIKDLLDYDNEHSDLWDMGKKLGNYFILDESNEEICQIDFLLIKNNLTNEIEPFNINYILNNKLKDNNHLPYICHCLHKYYEYQGNQMKKIKEDLLNK